MELNANTKIGDLLKEYPFLMEFLIAHSPKFKLLESAVMRKTVGKVATVAEAASIGNIEPAALLSGIAAEIRKRSGRDVAIGASAISTRCAIGVTPRTSCRRCGWSCSRRHRTTM